MLEKFYKKSEVWFAVIFIVAYVVGGAGLGLGIYVLKKELPGREMAIAGIVCGGIALAYTVFSIILGLIGVATPASKFDFEDIIDSLDL